MNAQELMMRASPWTGLVVSLAGWAIHQQLLADMLHYDCHLGDTPIAAVATVIVAVFVAVAGVVSWRSRRGSNLRQFVALLGVSSAAIALFAIALQLLAAMTLPGCGS